MDTFERTHPDIPVLRYNGDHVDFVQNKGDLEHILTELETTLKKEFTIMNLRTKYRIPSNAVITIAGTVGVGKSTMTNGLANALGFRTSFEKVDTNPYLDKFYQDFKSWSFHLQVYFLAERFKEQKKIFEYGGGFIQDRSIYEDTGIFARMHYEKGI